MYDPLRITNPHLTPELVYAQATYTPGEVQIYIPNHPILRNPTGLKKSKDLSLEEEDRNFVKETGEERSIRRARKKIGGYILCNEFELFITFTINDDRQNVNRSKQKVMNWLKNQRNRNGKFIYVVVPEFHKDGKSLHFHALVGGYKGKIVQVINPNTGTSLMQRGKKVMQLSEYRLGFTNVKVIGTSYDDRSRLAVYLKKYITKDMPTFKSRQRYWVSKGLNFPLVEDNPEEWYKAVEPDWSHKFDNGIMIRYNLDRNPIAKIFGDANARVEF